MGRKRKNLIAAVIVVLLLAAMIVPVSAADDVPSNFDEAMKRLQKEDKSWAQVVTFSIAATAEGFNSQTSLFTVAKNLLDLTGRDGDEFVSAIHNWGRRIFEGFEVIGIILMTLYFFLNILEKIEMEQFTTEQFFKKLIVFAIALFIMINGTEIFEGIIRIGNTMLNEGLTYFQQGDNGSTPMSDRLFGLYEALLKGNGITDLLLLVTTLIEYILPYLAQIACVVVIYFMSITRLVEIVVRYAFAPIALAPLAGDGLRSSSVRYIKQFASVCLQGVMIIFVMMLTSGLRSMMASSTASAVVYDVIGAIIMPIITIGTLSKCKKWADDIMGV